jgi:hypothetical protein
MQRIEDSIEDAVVDLGAASVETKGMPGVFVEILGEDDKPVGLTQD